MIVIWRLDKQRMKIAIIEDHVEFRQSLEFLFNSFSDYELAGSFGSVEAFMQQAVEAQVMLLDINLPGMSGLEALPLLKKRFPAMHIIMLTILDDDQHIMTAISQGADGYILKKSQPQKILDAVQQVFEGGASLTPQVARQVLAYFYKQNQPGPKNQDELTQREREILALITQGEATEHIAEKLFISTQTVRNHIKNIYGKLQVHSRAQAVSKALRERLV